MSIFKTALAPAAALALASCGSLPEADSCEMDADGQVNLIIDGNQWLNSGGDLRETGENELGGTLYNGKNMVGGSIYIGEDSCTYTLPGEPPVNTPRRDI